MDFSFIESDFRQVGAKTLGSFNIYLFDGPHEEQDQYDGFAMFHEVMDDDLIFIIDDWSREQVRLGTFKAIRDKGFGVDYAIEIRTTLDGSMPSGTLSDWYNGYFLSKLSRRERRLDPFMRL